MLVEEAMGPDEMELPLARQAARSCVAKGTSPQAWQSGAFMRERATFDEPTLLLPLISLFAARDDQQDPTHVHLLARTHTRSPRRRTTQRHVLRHRCPRCAPLRRPVYAFLLSLPPPSGRALTHPVLQPPSLQMTARARTPSRPATTATRSPSPTTSPRTPRSARSLCRGG